MLDSLSRLVSARVAQPRQGRRSTRWATAAGGSLAPIWRFGRGHRRILRAATTSSLDSPDRPIARPALVLGHFDTVWPRGTLERMPFRVEGGRAFGPGIYDMKAGLTIIPAVLDHVVSKRERSPRPIWVLFTSDEEIGSPTSRAPDRGPGATMCLRPGARAAAGRWQPEDRAQGRRPVPPGGRGQGRPCRRGAPGGPQRDRRAGAPGRTHPGVARPRRRDDAQRRRHPGRDDHERRAGRRRRPTSTCGSRPWRRRNASSGPCARSSRSPRGPGWRSPAASTGRRWSDPRRSPRCSSRPGGSAATIGLELTEGSTGGGSDGNFTAALGIPTLDGLGARGGGAHADDEHILIDSLPERAALLAALLLELQVEP